MKDTPCNPSCAIDAAADCKVDQPNNYTNCVAQYIPSCCCGSACMSLCSPSDFKCMEACQQKCNT